MPTKLRIMIELNTESGQIQMHGPLENELLLLRLLNRAAGMVVQYNVDLAHNRVKEPVVCSDRMN